LSYAARVCRRNTRAFQFRDQVCIFPDCWEHSPPYGGIEHVQYSPLNDTPTFDDLLVLNAVWSGGFPLLEFSVLVSNFFFGEFSCFGNDYVSNFFGFFMVNNITISAFKKILARELLT